MESWEAYIKKELRRDTGTLLLVYTDTFYGNMILMF